MCVLPIPDESRSPPGRLGEGSLPESGRGWIERGRQGKVRRKNWLATLVRVTWFWLAATVGRMGVLVQPLPVGVALCCRVKPVEGLGQEMTRLVALAGAKARVGGDRER